MSRLFSLFATAPPQPRSGPLLRKLLDGAQVIAAREVELFRFRLGEALLKLSETSNVPAEEQASFHACNHIRKDGNKLCAAFGAALNQHSSAALRALEENRADTLPLSSLDLDSAEDRLLLDDLAQALDRQAADALTELECNLAALLGRSSLPAEQNPWRPQIFLSAFYQAWCSIDPERASRRVMLGMLGPQMFLRLNAIYAGLNASLAEAGIVADAKALARPRHTSAPRVPAKRVEPIAFAATTSPAVRLKDERYYRVRDWLLAGSRASGAPAPDEPAHLNLPDLFAEPDEDGKLQANTISVAVTPKLFSHLTRLQQKLETTLRTAPAQGTDILRHISRGLPAGVLSPVDTNTLDLMEQVFERLLQSPDTPEMTKPLLVRLQIPVLKAALMDRKFFIDANHPAHRLLDQVLVCGTGWDSAKTSDDVLCLALSRAVDRIAAEFDQKLSLFTEVNAGLEALLQQEAIEAQAAVERCLPQALRAEKLYTAEQAARADILERLESGAVPYSLEHFLQSKWMRVLTLAHAGSRKKPEVLANARAMLDELLWSVQAKAEGNERRQLLQRLPGILYRLNTWLDAIKWSGPERTAFLAALAEQHAALVRTPREEGNARMETALAQAQRASERGMMGARKKIDGAARQANPVDSLCHGDWLELKEDGLSRALRIGWLSPQRSQLVLASRRGGHTRILSELELEHRLEQGQARIMKVEGAFNRALDAVLAGESQPVNIA